MCPYVLLLSEILYNLGRIVINGNIGQNKFTNITHFSYACCDMMDDEILEYNMVELTYEADVAQIE